MTQNPKSEFTVPESVSEKHLILSIRGRMLRKLSLCLTVMVAISLCIMWKYATEAFEIAYFYGAIIGILNGIVGFMTIEQFIDKSSLVFLKGIFIGMGIRLLLLLGIFVILVKVLDIHVIGLVTGLLVFYFAMTIFEVIFLNKRLEIKKSVKVAQ